MGIKSTTHLTRQEAIEKYADLKLDSVDPRRQFMAEAMVMPRKQLEDKLEEMNDARYDSGEGFDNYIITD